MKCYTMHSKLIKNVHIIHANDMDKSIYSKSEIDFLHNTMKLYFGSFHMLIKERTGLSRASISKFFTGKVISARMGNRIYETCIVLIEEKKLEHEQLRVKLKKTLAHDKGIQSELKLKKQS